eukprot:gene17301-biopygen2319
MLPGTTKHARWPTKSACDLRIPSSATCTRSGAPPASLRHPPREKQQWTRSVRGLGAGRACCSGLQFFPARHRQSSSAALVALHCRFSTAWHLQSSSAALAALACFHMQKQKCLTGTKLAQQRAGSQAGRRERRAASVHRSRRERRAMRENAMQPRGILQAAATRLQRFARLPPRTLQRCTHCCVVHTAAERTAALHALPCCTLSASPPRTPALRALLS